MLVWVPLFGTFVLGFELLFNGVVIGVVSTIVGMNRGISYPILGLVPHGIFEIPAFILEFASIICWHIAAIEIIMTKVIGEKVNGAKFKRGVKDAVILALASLILFVIAAFVETYVTPRLLGL
jgi:stage II sporulation protein M